MANKPKTTLIFLWSCNCSNKSTKHK